MNSKNRTGEIALLATLQEKVESLAVELEKIKVAEYVDMLNNPRRLFFLNFIAGLARGVGTAIGFTILGAVILMILRELVVLNLPLIGGLIAEIVRLVQMQGRV
ncbi:DUF5665 domain-containing protein [Heliophilum fasciatum]|uniref:Uncharacterized protein n=1 Tax=Heliophilum fasciatum TaxID=35700 RepID=A0A4R2RIX7_9FIRM|nr:DUF5665 domain-containing protein [Heliophilum fasciatum]MCW2278891.1 hypothetical protein [Heliophilum fasciatum]TCP62097.1 hypothetical protein EDD73_1233 [Heliophilum fasciatum]